MRLKLLISFLVLICFYSFSQVRVETDKAISEKVLRSYLNAGVGSTNKYLNLGAGFFLPVSKNILIGPRANSNIEMNILETPVENINDINLEMRYVPLINNWFVVSAGLGAGYSFGTKRGQLIGINNAISPEYEKIKYSSFAGLVEIDSGFLITNNFGISLSANTLFTKNETLFRYQLGLFLCKILE